MQNADVTHRQEEKISIIIPTYRRPKMLERAIASVLAQTYDNLEVLVVNDNEVADEYSRELYQLIKRFAADGRVKLVEQQRHANGAVARNVGIRAASGEYIAFLDDDDYWEPEKLELQLELLRQLSSEYGLVGCLSKRVNARGDVIWASLPYKTGDVLFEVIARDVRLGIGAVLIKREALEETGYFDERLRRHQDLQLFSQLCSKYKVGLIRRYLYNVDVSDASNRPANVESAIAFKEAFFESISDVMNSFGQKQVVQIKRAHAFEIANAYRKEGDIKKCLKLLKYAFSSPKSTRLIAHRLLELAVGKIFKDALVAIYR